MKLRIHVEGRAYEVEVDFLDAAPAAGRGALEAPLSGVVFRPRPPQRLPEDSLCRSPIAGRVTAVIAAAGRNVRRNEPVVLIEAMKMQIPIGPAVDGVVKAILVVAGEAVGAGQVLFELA